MNTNHASSLQENRKIPENRVRLEGELTQAAEMRTTPSGVSVATLEMQHVSESGGTPPLQRLELKIPVIALDRLAETCEELATGTRIRVEGRLNQKRWVRENRVRWGRMELIAEKLEILHEEF